MFKRPNTKVMTSVGIALAIAFIAAVATSTAPATTESQGLPTLGFHNINLSLNEPSGINAETRTSTVILSTTSSQTVTVNYTFIPITTEVDDYIGADGTLTFPAGSTSENIESSSWTTSTQKTSSDSASTSAPQPTPHWALTAAAKSPSLTPTPDRS